MEREHVPLVGQMPIHSKLVLTYALDGCIFKHNEAAHTNHGDDTMNSYNEIASNLAIWNEFFNTDAAMTDEEFYEMSVEDKIKLLIAAFG